MISGKWNPIQPAEPESEQYDFSEINSLHEQWISIKAQQENSDPKTHSAFLERLGRSWSIETGILEGLYVLDRGVTETLIENGLVADYIERNSTNKEPRELVKILRDHQDSIEFVYRQIKDGYPLTKLFIRQLHMILARNQDTFQAVDQFENVFDTVLDKGGFKKLPNNPTRPDGVIHEYCPPEQVESELDNLLSLYEEYQRDRSVYHPLLTAAWLHHRFTQIHPFQDGNGRVARALLTWHLVKEEFLPIVISRDERDQYIGALELADQGNLIPLIDLMTRLEQWSILQALGEPELEAEPGLVDQVVATIVDQIKRQSQDQENQMRGVNTIALALRDAAKSNLSNKAAEIRERLTEAGMSVVPLPDQGGPGDKEHWYRREVTETAKSARHWANLKEPRFFVKLSLNPEAPRTARLVFVVSLHNIGAQLTGIMAATAFARIEHYPDDSSDRQEESGGAYFRDCTVNPFTFTWKDNVEAITPRFLNWTEQCFSVALTYWRGFLA